MINTTKMLIAAAIATMFTAAALWPCQANATDITVVVNGQPVNFNGPPPIEQDGTVLVPLRGVFEALGAGVVYDPATRTISARKGRSFVVLPIGSTEATVNGQQEQLSVPATVTDGSTFIPLRFVAEALGAYVEWQAADNTVAITSASQPVAQVPPVSGMEPITGRLTEVNVSAFPRQITVRADGIDTSIPVSRGTIVFESVAGQPRDQVSLDELQTGDRVVVQRDDRGVADTVTIRFDEVRGRVGSISRSADGNRVVTMGDGTSVELAPFARVRLNGNEIAFRDIAPGQRVAIRTDPNSNLGYAVILNPAFAHRRGQE